MKYVEPSAPPPGLACATSTTPANAMHSQIAFIAVSRSDSSNAPSATNMKGCVL